MSLLSLRESLARSKDKWKKRLHIGSRSTSPAPPPISNQPIASTPGDDDDPTNRNMVWSGVKTMLQVLESSSDAFGPLKSAIGGLNKCIDIYERAAKGRKDYDELREKLDELLNDLAGHMAQPMDSMMTSSVTLLCRGIEGEIKKVKTKQDQTTGQRLLQAMDTSEDILECYRRINGYLKRLTLNANMSILKAINELTMEARLDRISPATAASYNSTESDDIKRGGCTLGTRQPQIDLLLEWAHDQDAGRTCWINGMAGTGKTTIAYTVCTKLDESSELGASFFCSRVIPECRQVKNIIPSISYQLARYSLPFRCALNKILEQDPDARTRALKIQYQKLIVEPLVKMQSSLPTDFIIVIDALDECENEEIVGQILDLLLSTASSLPIRFLISSRPEPEITRRLANCVGEQSDTPLVLHDLDADAVKSDIAIYMRRELEKVPLTDAQRNDLFARCGTLFIYAATTCRYVLQGYAMDTLDEAVTTITKSATTAEGREDEKTIDELYSTILTAAFNTSSMSKANKHRMRDILETVLCVQEPLTLGSLANMLGLSTKQAERLLQPLRSVLNITPDTKLVTTLHASFPDFMFSTDFSANFGCLPSVRHAAIVKACFRMIDAVEPKFNICDLQSSYLSDAAVEDIEERVAQKISFGLIYACRYWSTHLYLGELSKELVDLVYIFFTERLLLWMEVMNLAKHMRFGTNIIQVAEKWCRQSNVPHDLIKLVRDAVQFVSVYANHSISQSTPHIYVSMLGFWPQSRPISIAYMPRTSGILEPRGTAIARRQPVLLATWKVSGGVYFICLSSDGRQIVAATNKGTIDILDTSTGDGVFHLQNESTQEIKAIAVTSSGSQIAFGSTNAYILDVQRQVTWQISTESNVLSIVISPDESQLAVGLSSGNICVYALQTRELVLGPLGPLEGHTKNVNSISFSPDGRFIASGSRDSIIRIWDVRNGQMIGHWHASKEHSDWVYSVSFSPDGTRLASASSDRTIRVWDPLTGQTVLGPLTQHSDSVRSVTFSPNGAFIASGSIDQNIRVYDAKTGQTILGPLHGHTHFVTSVIFSPDSTQLYSGSIDDTIRLWNIQDLSALNLSQPYFPNSFRSVRYSPDGLQVVSGADDGSVSIWDVQTGEMVLGPLKGHSEYVWAVDYSPDGAYIASASHDYTLRVWSARDGSDIHGPIQGHTHGINCVQFSPDGSLLVSGSDDYTMLIWYVATGRPMLEPFEGHSERVWSVAFSPNGVQVVSGSFDHTIRVWDINTGQTVLGPLQGHKDGVSSVNFSPDGLHIISGSWDGSIQVWDAQTGQSLLSWHINQAGIHSLSLSPDSLLMVSGHGNGTTSVWDAQTGDLLLTFKVHSHFVTSVQFSPDGSHVVSSSVDGTIWFCDVSSRITTWQSNSLKEPGKAQMSTDLTSDPWSLNKDGWLIDQQGLQLVWMPEDLRIGLLQHTNDQIICKEGVLKLNFDEVNIGQKWTECYRP